MSTIARRTGLITVHVGGMEGREVTPKAFRLRMVAAKLAEMGDLRDEMNLDP